jgi:hypothetical protein
MSINQYRYVLKVVSVFTLVPLKTHWNLVLCITF